MRPLIVFWQHLLCMQRSLTEFDPAICAHEGDELPFDLDDDVLLRLGVGRRMLCVHGKPLP